MIVTGAEDDSFDTDVGYQGNIQYAIAVQRAGGAVGDSMMETDSDGNEDAVPRQRVAISNFTFVHRNAAAGNAAARSEERPVGTECGSTCSSGRPPFQQTKTTQVTVQTGQIVSTSCKEKRC